MTFDSQEFTIVVDGEVTSKTWTGTFAAKRVLSHRDYLEIDKKRRALLGADTTTDERAMSTAHILAELSQRLTKFEDWWRDSKFGLDLPDFNVIAELYKQATKIENDYFDNLKKEKEKKEAALRQKAEELK